MFLRPPKKCLLDLDEPKKFNFTGSRFAEMQKMLDKVYLAEKQQPVEVSKPSEKDRPEDFAEEVSSKQ